MNVGFEDRVAFFGNLMSIGRPYCRIFLFTTKDKADTWIPGNSEEVKASQAKGSNQDFHVLLPDPSSLGGLGSGTDDLLANE